MSQPGTLFVVATPLGNLGDLTVRAADILRRVPIVAAEDTRRTQGLLAHLNAHPKLLSFHAHSPAQRTSSLLEILEGGRDVALVSDAGTPAISDPGAELVATVRQAGIPVVPIPGVTALATTLSVAGVAADRFLFLGFIPRKGKERERLLTMATASEWPVVFYEAPPRLVTLLRDLLRLTGADRGVVVARELTKVFEEIRPSTLAEAVEHFEAIPARGELTLVLEGAGEAPEKAVDEAEVARLASGLLAEGMSRRAVVQQLVKTVGVARNEAYRIVMEIP